MEFTLDLVERGQNLVHFYGGISLVPTGFLRLEAARVVETRMPGLIRLTIQIRPGTLVVLRPFISTLSARGTLPGLPVPIVLETVLPG